MQQEYELPPWVSESLGGLPWERAIQRNDLERKLKGVRPGGLFWFPDHKIVLVDAWKFDVCNDGRGGNADRDPCYQRGTALLDKRGFALNAETQPWGVLPWRATGNEFKQMGLWKGDLCIAFRKDKWAAAVFGDLGPEDKFSEGSKFLARKLEIPDNPRRGGLRVPMFDRSDGVVWLCFCGTENTIPMSRTNSQIEADALRHYGLFRPQGRLCSEVSCDAPR